MPCIHSIRIINSSMPQYSYDAERGEAAVRVSGAVS